MEITFRTLIEQEDKGYRVKVLRNGVLVYEAAKVSGTQAKAEKRAVKQLAAELLKESRALKTGGSDQLALPGVES